MHEKPSCFVGFLTTLIRKENDMGRQRAQVAPKPAQAQVIEVPVKRLAEYVPGSFTAANDSENDPLNADDTRWYRTGDDTLGLMLDDRLYEFHIDHLIATCTRAKALSITSVDDLIGLE